jgi:hypothetical protein
MDGTLADSLDNSLFIPIVNNVSFDDIVFFSKSDQNGLDSLVGTAYKKVFLNLNAFSSTFLPDNCLLTCDI